MLNDEQDHIRILTSVITRWKEIYHKLPVGTAIFCHDFSTLHEFTASKIRWCNIAMKSKDHNLTTISYFDYLTRNKASTISLLRVWNSFLRNESHQIPSTISTLCIYSDSHEKKNNMHVYIMDMIQRRLKKTVLYISLPPYHGHNICDGHFAHGKQRLKSIAIDNGLQSIEQVVTAISTISTSVNIIEYDKNISQPTEKIVKIKKYFGFLFVGDGLVYLYDQNLKFDHDPQESFKLSASFRKVVDEFVGDCHNYI